MARTVVPSIVLFLCIVLLPAFANAQELPARSYLFVEVANENGERVSDANVRLSAVNGKEVVNAYTDKNGSIQSTFYRYRDLRYNLQITKAGYLPYESVLFATIPFDQYFLVDRLTEEMPQMPEAPKYGVGPPAGALPVRITLQTKAQGPVAKLEAQKQLLLSVKRGDAQTLKTLLQQGGEPNAADAKGVPAVAWAAFAGDPETIKVLLDADADVRNKGRQALLIYLLHGVNRNRFDNATIERLIQAGVDVNASDQNGQTPLIIATRMNQRELIKLLVDAGAKPVSTAPDDLFQ